jgi:hypothetical protein
MRTLPALVLAAATVACASPAAVSTGTTATQDAGVDTPTFPDVSQCAGLAEPACKATSECAPLYGKPAKPAPACAASGPLAYLGCDVVKGCPEAIGCATDPASGKHFFVSSLCAPPGWVTDGNDGGTPACCGVAACEHPPIARLCVLGDIGNAHDFLVTGHPIQVQLWPKGCFSSSCTQIVGATCDVGAEVQGEVQVSGGFCLADKSTPGGPCTADCSGGSTATCEGGAWTAGQHVVRAGNLAVTVEVPAAIEMGGVCTGTQF